MTRSAVAMVPSALLVLSALLAAGCGNTGADAPPPTGDGAISLSDLPPIPSPEGGAHRVAIILEQAPGVRGYNWQEAARREAADQGVVFSVRAPREGERRADLVRRAAREGASVLIIAPGDNSEAMVEALADVRARGVPALTILGPTVIDGEALPAVVRSEYEPVAEQLVEAVITDLPTINKAPDGLTLVLFDKEFSEAKPRAEALFDAAEAAGLPLIGDGPLGVTGGREAAEEAIEAARAAHPDLSAILVGDDYCLLAAIELRDQAEGQVPPFAFAGFIVDPDLLVWVNGSYASALAFADETVLGIYAVRHALKLIEGESVPDRIVAPLPVRRAPGPPAPVPSSSQSDDFEFDPVLGPMPSPRDAR